MTITVVFDPPLPSDSPTTFNTKAFSTLGDLNDWSAEANALAAEINSGVPIATATHAATSKATPVDADEIPLADSAATWGLKKLTWANIKATLATWIGGGTIAGGFTTLASSGNTTLGDAEATDTHDVKGATTVLANSASAALKVTQTGSGNAFVVEDSASTDSTPFVIDANGSVVAGHTGTVLSGPVMQTVSTVAAGLGSVNVSADTNGPVHTFAKARGTVGTPTVVLSGDTISRVDFSGHDGTGYIVGARITAAVDGTPGTNDMPGRLVFSTTADGAASPTEALRINSSQAIGIGTALPQVSLYNTRNISGNVNSFGNYLQATVQSDVTSAAYGFRSNISTVASAFTLSSHYAFYAGQGTIGATSAITNQYGYVADSTLIGATTNYGFYGNIPNAAGRFNFYAAGDAPNRFVGETLVIGPAGLGYGTGAGGTVTQATSKVTAVTLNKPTGQITMNNAALAAGTEVFFSLTNSLITSADVVVCNLAATLGGSYVVRCSQTYTGGATIGVKNITAGSLSDTPIITFSVIKGATS